jgi:hypothetical protein
MLRVHARLVGLGDAEQAVESQPILRRRSMTGESHSVG